VLLGSRERSRSPLPPGRLMAASVAAVLLPDLDLLLPKMLDAAGVDRQLDSGVHHRWVTHTPALWGMIAVLARRAARLRPASPWSGEAARLLALGAGIHLLQDAVANTVSLLWPLRRREYGLGLDGMPEVTDHREYVRRYPATAAGILEAAIIIAALGASRPSPDSRGASLEAQRRWAGPFPGRPRQPRRARTPWARTRAQGPARASSGGGQGPAPSGGIRGVLASVCR
jgi:hypothetical protein